MELTEDAVVVDEISPVDIRLFVDNDRVVEGNGDGGEAALANVRVAVAGIGTAGVLVVFSFNSPSGIVSNFSLAEQLEKNSSWCSTD